MDERRERRERQVWGHLADRGPLTARQLADDLGLDTTFVEQFVARSLLNGRLVIAGHDARGIPRYVIARSIG